MEDKNKKIAKLKTADILSVSRVMSLRTKKIKPSIRDLTICYLPCTMSCAISAFATHFIGVKNKTLFYIPVIFDQIWEQIMTLKYAVQNGSLLSCLMHANQTPVHPLNSRAFLCVSDS